jgi:hypothetical protein
MLHYIDNYDYHKINTLENSIRLIQNNLYIVFEKLVDKEDINFTTQSFNQFFNNFDGNPKNGEAFINKIASRVKYFDYSSNPLDSQYIKSVNLKIIKSYFQAGMHHDNIKNFNYCLFPAIEEYRSNFKNKSSSFFTNIYDIVKKIDRYDFNSNYADIIPSIKYDERISDLLFEPKILEKYNLISKIERFINKNPDNDAIPYIISALSKNWYHDLLKIGDINNILKSIYAKNLEYMVKYPGDDFTEEDKYIYLKEIKNNKSIFLTGDKNKDDFFAKYAVNEKIKEALFLLNDKNKIHDLGEKEHGI